MAWFRREKPVEPAPEHRDLMIPRMAGWAQAPAGVDVTFDSSLRNAAVWACQRVLISTVARMPVNCLRIPSGSVAAEKAAVVSPKVVARPDATLSQRAWVGQAMRSGVQAGNIYGWVSEVDGSYRPSDIKLIHPSQVSWTRRPDGETALVNGKPERLWTEGGHLWHVPISQFMVPGSRVALSPTEYASTSIGTGLAAEDFGARFFGDGAHPTSVAYVDKEITADEAEVIKQRVLNLRRSREPAVFGSGIKLDQIAVNPSDSQFIDLLGFEVEQACRFWGVPPAMVYAAISGQSITYANVTQSDAQYLKYSISAWICDLEDAWSDLVSNQVFVRFDVDDALRMDPLARAQVAQLQLANKTVSVNELRYDEDEPPWDDPIYDLPGLPGAPTMGAPGLLEPSTPAPGAKNVKL